MAVLAMLKGDSDSPALLTLIESPDDLLGAIRRMVDSDGLALAKDWDPETINAETEGLDDAGVISWWCTGSPEQSACVLREYEWEGELVIGGSPDSGATLHLTKVSSIPMRGATVE